MALFLFTRFKVKLDDYFFYLYLYQRGQFHDPVLDDEVETNGGGGND
jgi:hypothetical protein